MLHTLCISTLAASAPEFTVSLPASASSALGRVRVYLSDRCGPHDPPPRAQCKDDQETSQVFGVDTPAAGLQPGTHIGIGEHVAGYPRHSIREIPAGAYCVQAELYHYKIYNRGDGENLTLPTSCVSDAGGDGAYGSPAGTLFSDVLEIIVEPGGIVGPIDLPLAHTVKPSASPGCSGKGGDTKWIKTVRVQSKLLSAFWGEPMELEACVLLPFGFDTHPTAKYPLLVAHGHYSSVFQPGGRFDDVPPSNQSGYSYVDQLYAYYLFRNWTSDSGPFRGARALVMTINQPVPFFDDAYSVDSVNVGPYGSAIVGELIPAVEKQYRGIGEGVPSMLMHVRTP